MILEYTLHLATLGPLGRNVEPTCPEAQKYWSSFFRWYVKSLKQGLDIQQKRVPAAHSVSQYPWQNVDALMKLSGDVATRLLLACLAIRITFFCFGVWVGRTWDVLREDRQASRGLCVRPAWGGWPYHIIDLLYSIIVDYVEWPLSGDAQPFHSSRSGQ